MQALARVDELKAEDMGFGEKTRHTAYSLTNRCRSEGPTSCPTTVGKMQNAPHNFVVQERAAS